MTNHIAVEQVPLGALKPAARQLRKHPQKQIKELIRSINAFGFNAPLIISNDNEIISGHARLEAARQIGMTHVPCLRLGHMTPEELRGFRIADNRIAEGATWDFDLLAEELQDLIKMPDLDFSIEDTGFEAFEIDAMIDDLDGESSENPEDDALPSTAPRRVQPGDIWQIGPHRLICGSALDPAVLGALMQGQLARMAFTDPPYNVPIDGHVGGGGKIKHREFAMASGEMTRGEFTEFLTTALQNLAAHTVDGAILMVCMDWRHLLELQMAGESIGLTLKNLCVWNKKNGGQGSFYRSQHELVFVFKKGSAPHMNNFGLGENGRNRTNVWTYRGATALTEAGRKDLAAHPTVKPAQMIADAIRDVSGRGEIVVDVFAGSGSTLAAAERTGRVAHLAEIDPLYCDLILTRAETLMNETALQVLCGWPKSSLTE